MNTNSWYKQSDIAGFLASQKGMLFNKNMRKQIPAINVTPLVWIDTEEGLHEAIKEILDCLKNGCNTLAVDLEYHCVERKAIIISLIQLSTCDKDYIIDALALRKEVI